MPQNYSQQPNRQNILLIDGAYFSLGTYEIQEKTNRRLEISEKSIKFFINFLEKTTGVNLT